MTRPLKRMPTPLGVGAGQTASCNLPLGLTYERLYIRLNVDVATVATDVALADWGTYINEIRVMVDGDAKIELTATALVALNAYYDQTKSMTPGVLPLFLSRPWMRSILGEDQSGYGTMGGISTLSLEMDLKDGITINSLDVYASQSNGKPFGPHLRIQKITRNQGVTGEAQISEINRGSYVMLAAHVATADIGDVEILADERVVHKSDAALRDSHYAVIGRVPQAGYTHIDFVTENRLSEAMPMELDDFRMNLDFTATGNFPIYLESLQGQSRG